MTMDDLISRRAVRLALSEVDIPKGVIETEFYDVMSNVVDRLIAVPSVDAVPVKHGKWFDAMVGELPVQVCDQCNTFFPLAYTGGGHHYCPNCGAKMDLEE